MNPNQIVMSVVLAGATTLAFWTYLVATRDSERPAPHVSLHGPAPVVPQCVPPLDFQVEAVSVGCTAGECLVCNRLRCVTIDPAVCR